MVDVVHVSFLQGVVWSLLYFTSTPDFPRYESTAKRIAKRKRRQSSERMGKGARRSRRKFGRTRRDHVMAPFECDFCIFHKLKLRDPIRSSQADNLLLAVIRQANLDMSWSSASQTVDENRKRIVKVSTFSASIGLQGPYIQKGPFHNTTIVLMKRLFKFC